MNKHGYFLEYVSKYVEEHPDVSAYVQQSVAEGLENYIYRLKLARSNMEVALNFSLSKKHKDTKRWIVEKIKECGNLVSMKWDWYTENVDD